MSRPKNIAVLRINRSLNESQSEIVKLSQSDALALFLNKIKELVDKSEATPVCIIAAEFPPQVPLLDLVRAAAELNLKSLN